VARRVVVTGLGVLSPIGNDVPSFWAALLEGKSGITKITRFPVDGFNCQIAAELKDFKPEDTLGKKASRRMDRFVQYASVAALESISHSKLDLDKVDKNRMGVVIGSGIGGLETLEREHEKLRDRGPTRVSPFLIPMMICDMASGQVSIMTGAKGPNYACVSACASAAHSISDACWLIQSNQADVMIAGGAEAAITPVGIAGFDSMKALSTRNEKPEQASSPFDRKRDGFVMGEGAGILILEDLSHAEKRGAAILAELVGFGITADASHITQPAPGGEGAIRAMSQAIESAGIAKEEVDYINAHGTSTPYNDKNETAAIKTLFGTHAKSIHISSTKSMTGHLLGASGGIEAVATVMSIQKSIIHPTTNYQDPDPDCDLNYTPNVSVSREIRVALSNSFGFGGHNATLAFKKFQ